MEGSNLKALLSGNEAIARGAYEAGVQVITGYPGTPSSEIVKTAAQLYGDEVYVEWSTNEKVAMDAAAGAAYSGKRTMCTPQGFRKTQKQVRFRIRWQITAAS